MYKKYRIKSKFRFTIFTALMLALVISLTGLVTGTNTADSLTKNTYAKVQVQDGDNLWSLAEEFGPEDQDTRKVVYEICKLNQITADSIFPGQVILIPAYI